ncbi:uncharacterized protein LAESUDRAFT_761680 [Laetiporus sulphureus 93-53]|uniref:Uncharacterized protein n=1 Tax=Laetiporus sulphureus 93-53 TaxID=1314785 RepID=A0A165CZT1_9APHY|nr:uncharacterized protein LAESUDRAFT_761680 [Laetiporus sulphureus 93-53]KZT03843.1 hypothetical protein LAESUDRAFT_761680 [Laetiporus sulphureus 93-53]
MRLPHSDRISPPLPPPPFDHLDMARAQKSATARGRKSLTSFFKGSAKSEPDGDAASSDFEAFEIEEEVEKPTAGTNKSSALAPDASDLPSIHNVPAIFSDLVVSAPQIKAVTQHLQGHKMRVATMCSGTESPLLALDLIRRSILEHYDVKLECEHVFSCEIEPSSRRTSSGTSNHPCCSGMSVSLGTHMPYGSLAPVPGDVDILIAGTSCVDYSNLNNEKQDIDANGESGRTFRGLMSWVKNHRPPLVILENVCSAPWERVVEYFEKNKCSAHSLRVDTKDFYRSHTRTRVCLLAVDQRNSDLPDAWAKLLNKLKRPASSTLDAFLLPSDDFRIHQAREKLISESYNAVDRRRGRTDWGRFESQRTRLEMELGSKRPLTSWEEGGFCKLPVVACNDWGVGQVERVWDLMDISFLRSAKKGVDPSYKTQVWNLSQDIDRTIGSNKVGICPCLTPSMIPYITNRGGPVVGIEAFSMQGLPVDELFLTRETEDQLADLAGNAMCTTVVGACIMAALIMGRKLLKEGSDVSTYESRNDMSMDVDVDMKDVQDDSMDVDQAPDDIPVEDHVSGEDQLVNQPLDLASTAVVPRSSTRRTAARRPASSAVVGRSTTLSTSMPTHIHGNLQRLLRKSSKSTLPMSLSVSNISQALLDSLKEASGHELRFVEPKRQDICVATYQSPVAHLKLLLYRQQAEWRLFAKPEENEPANSELRRLLAPVGRMACRGGLFAGRWDFALPHATSERIAISGSEPVPSWAQRLGLQGDEFKDKMEDLVHFDRDILGVYTLLDKCGTANSALHKKESDEHDSHLPPLFLILDPTRRGDPSDDRFAIFISNRRYEYGETPPLVCKFEPKWRQCDTVEEQSIECHILQTRTPGVASRRLEGGRQGHEHVTFKALAWLIERIRNVGDHFGQWQDAGMKINESRKLDEDKSSRRRRGAAKPELPEMKSSRRRMIMEVVIPPFPKRSKSPSAMSIVSFSAPETTEGEDDSDALTRPRRRRSCQRRPILISDDEEEDAQSDDDFVPDEDEDEDEDEPTMRCSARKAVYVKRPRKWQDSDYDEFWAEEIQSEDEMAVDDVVTSDDDYSSRSLKPPTTGKICKLKNVVEKRKAQDDGERPAKKKRETKDPWKLRSIAVSKDWTRMQAPPLEMFHFSRKVVDKYTYLDGKIHSMVTNITAERYWVLSGIHDFGVLKTISAFFNLHLGMDDDAEGQSVQVKKRRKEQTAVETFHSFRDVHSLEWHAHRPQIRQSFLDQFVRQNIAEIDEIPSSEEIRKRGRKSESDRQKRVAQALGESSTAEEALLKRCSHFGLGSSDKENATKTCEVIVWEQRAQLDSCKGELKKMIAEALEKEKMIGKVETESLFREYIRITRTSLRPLGDHEQAARRARQSKSKGRRPAGECQAAHLEHREQTHEIRRVMKELVGRVRSLRYFTAVRDLQKQADVLPVVSCPLCGRDQVPIEEVVVFSPCGHTGCIACVTEHAEREECVYAASGACKALSLYVAHRLLFREIALKVVKEPEPPVCCLNPLELLGPPAEEDVLLSIDDWKARRLGELKDPSARLPGSESATISGPTQLADSSTTAQATQMPYASATVAPTEVTSSNVFAPSPNPSISEAAKTVRGSTSEESDQETTLSYYIEINMASSCAHEAVISDSRAETTSNDNPSTSTQPFTSPVPSTNQAIPSSVQDSDDTLTVSSESPSMTPSIRPTTSSSNSVVSPSIASASVAQQPFSLPESQVPTGGESIYWTIMNRLTALEGNTTLYARYVEEQTADMREILRSLGEDVGRLEGIAQAQMYLQSMSEFDRHRRRLELEPRELLSRVNRLTDEVVLEKRLGIAQLCLLLAIMVFIMWTDGSRGELHRIRALGGQWKPPKQPGWQAFLERQKNHDGHRAGDVPQATAGVSVVWAFDQDVETGFNGRLMARAGRGL